MTLAATILGILFVISTSAGVMMSGAAWPFELYLIVVLAVCGALAGALILIVGVAVGHSHAPGQTRNFDDVLNGLFAEFLLDRFVADRPPPQFDPFAPSRTAILVRTPGRQAILRATGALLMAAVISEIFVSGLNWLAAIPVAYAAFAHARVTRRHRWSGLRPATDAGLKLGMYLAVSIRIVGLHALAGTGFDHWWLLLAPGYMLLFLANWLRAAPPAKHDAIANVFD